ncbi:Nucleoid occlusion factor SlmA [Poriferisphaera corsica]|uniref:Nucleoid occlusion factor SlmA n=1 Tax=Poriferisphaera corsica TaxID=2528020 RepID=A0A517YQ21_9BACT|nr:TetR/AcrR family transcriptional regulator [Poriferisphaera corsica]QDU32324.1 Nucleoid occlusion factor SlmA [Poriferisphaera corsica]
MSLATYKQRDFVRRESEILDALTHRLNRTPFDQITIDQIAQQTGISKGTIYNHINTKEDLLAKLYIRFRLQLLSELEAVNFNQPAPIIIKDMIAKAFAYKQSHRVIGTIDHHAFAPNFKSKLTPDIRNQIEQIEDNINQLVISVLQRGINEGDFPKRPVEDLFHCLHCAIIGIFTRIWECDTEPIPPNQIASICNLYSDFILAGLLALDD